MKNIKERDFDFVFCSDIHLKKLIWKNRPQLHSDTYNSFNFVAQYCKDNNCDLVLGGDVFDSPYPSTEDILVAKNVISLVKESGNEVFWIDGNHDVSNPSWASLLDVVNINRKQFCFKGIKFYGFSYTPEAFVPGVLGEIPKDTNILVCHQLLDLAAPFAGTYNMKAENVPDFIHTVLLGDVHEHETYYEPTTGKEFKYNGSTAFLRTNEPDEKFFYHAKFSDKVNAFEFNSIQIPTRPVYRELINDKDDIDSFVSFFNSRKSDFEKEEPIVILTYEPSLFELFTFLPDLKRYSHVWTIPNHTSKQSKDISSISVSSDISSKDILKELINSDKNETLFNFCSELLESPDFNEVIASYRSNYKLETL